MKVRRNTASSAPGDFTVGGRILASDGSAVAPSWTFAGDPTVGAYRSGTTIRLTCGTGGDSYVFGGSSFGVANSLGMIELQSTRVLGEAADVFAQRNATTAQTHRIYNTYTDASNYERLAIQWSSNRIRIEGENAGTGSDREMVIKSKSLLSLETANSGAVIVKPNGTDRATFTGAGGLTLDITSGSLRINNQVSGAAAATGTLTNAPTAGNPAFWLPVSIAGTLRHIPCW